MRVLARRYVISGRVQGVFYRAETKKKADEFGIAGWVQNNSDGTVEVHAEGTEIQLELLEAWLREGPELAAVIEMKTEKAKLGELSSFQIR